MEKVNIMEENKWIANKLKITAHFDANPGLPQEPAVVALLQVGDDNIDQQDAAWTSITTMCRGMENNPIGRGRQSDIDPTIDAKLKALCGGPFRDAALANFANLTTTCGESIIWQRGGVAVENAEDYADYHEKKMYNSLVRALRANENPKDSDRVLWDGSFNKKGHVTGITLNPKVKEDSE